METRLLVYSIKGDMAVCRTITMMNAVIPLSILPNGVAVGDLVIKCNGSFYEFDTQAMKLRDFVAEKYEKRLLKNEVH